MTLVAGRLALGRADAPPMARSVIVGIGEGRVTDRADTTLVTYSLGSCIGVTCFDPVARVGGMVHCMLPAASADPAKAAARPGMYVDSGVQRLLQALVALGAAPRRLVIKAAGGAAVLTDRSLFDIGARNALALRRVLWQFDRLLAAEDLGGRKARTLRLDLGTGRTTVSQGGTEREL